MTRTRARFGPDQFPVVPHESKEARTNRLDHPVGTNGLVIGDVLATIRTRYVHWQLKAQQRARQHVLQVGWRD